MALYGRDANGNDAYIRGTGAGSNTDGYLTFHDVFSDEVKFATATQLAATLTSDLVTAVAGAKIRVLSLTISAADACSVKFETGASAAVVAGALVRRYQASRESQSQLSFAARLLFRTYGVHILFYYRARIALDPRFCVFGLA